MENPEEKSFCENCGCPLPPSDGPSVIVRPRRRSMLSAVIRIFAYVFVLFGCQSCVMSGYASSIMLREGILDMSVDAMERVLEVVNDQMVMILLIANLLTLLIISLGVTLRRRRAKDELGLAAVNFLRIPTFALFGVALNVFVSVTLSFIPFPEEFVAGLENQYVSLHGGENLVLEILSVAVLAGLTEELIFRGIAMTRLKHVTSAPIAVIVSAIIFGVAHGTPIAILYATLLGVLLALLYNTYESVIPCIVCHIFFNMTSYFIPSEINGKTMILYAASIVVVLFCTYRIFIRRPTFYDILLDVDGRIPKINDEEKAIFDRLQKAKMDGSMTPEELEELENRWAENRKNHAENLKKERKNKQYKNDKE